MRVDTADNDEIFPVPLPWEDFTEEAITIEQLRRRTGNYELLLTMRCRDGEAPALVIGETMKLLSQSTVNIPPSLLRVLADDLHVIALWFLVTKARADDDADATATRRYLNSLTKSGQPIFDALRHVISLLPNRVADHLTNEGSEGAWDADDVLRVKDFLVAFERILPLLHRNLHPRRGRRPKFVLQQAAKLAAAALARGGLPVEAHGHTVKHPEPYLSGAGANTFANFFKLLGARVGEPELARALMRAHRVQPN